MILKRVVNQLREKHALGKVWVQSKIAIKVILGWKLDKSLRK